MAICIPAKPLSRRSVLRGLSGGAAITVGLPRLGAMLNGNGTAFAAGEPLPKRFGVWFWGNGISPGRWKPAATGVGGAWALSEQLMPFANVKKYLTVLTGYDVKIAGEVHKEGPAGALSGAPHDASGNYTAPTIDHVIANIIGTTSAFRSLVVGVSRATANGNGHAINYASSSMANAPVMPQYDARQIFKNLFVNAPVATDNSPQRRKRVLDTIAEDARALRTRLGTADRARLDQHLQGIDALERRIGMIPTVADPYAACGLPRDSDARYPASVDDNNGSVSDQQNEAIAELVTYALACDRTRVFCFQHGRPAAHYDMNVIGIKTDIHDDISHQEPGDQPKMNTAILYWMNHCRVLIEKMQNTPDGPGSNLLDNSCVYGTSDISYGKDHLKNEYPALLFGRAGGAIKGDQHVRAAGDNISKVLFTLANVFGANVKTFGSGEGTV